MSSSTSSPQTPSSTESDTSTLESTTAESSSSTPTDATSEKPTEETPATPESDQEATEEVQDAPGGDKASKARQEAAKYRKRAQAAETERDQAMEQVAALRQALVGNALERHGRGVTLDALTAAGHDTAALFDGASLDTEKLTDAITDTAKRFNIRVGVVPTQGTGEAAPRAGTESKNWGDAFREVTANKNPVH